MDGWPNPNRYSGALIDMRERSTALTLEGPSAEEQTVQVWTKSTGVIPFPKRVAADAALLPESTPDRLGRVEIGLLIFTAALGLACIAIALSIAFELV